MSCQFNFFYWRYLMKHQEKIKINPRMARMLHNLKFLDDDEKAAVHEQAQRFIEDLDKEHVQF